MLLSQITAITKQAAVGYTTHHTPTPHCGRQKAHTPSPPRHCRTPTPRHSRLSSRQQQENNSMFVSRIWSEVDHQATQEKQQQQSAQAGRVHVAGGHDIACHPHAEVLHQAVALASILQRALRRRADVATATSNHSRPPVVALLLPRCLDYVVSSLATLAAGYGSSCCLHTWFDLTVCSQYSYTHPPLFAVCLLLTPQGRLSPPRPAVASSAHATSAQVSTA